MNNPKKLYFRKYYFTAPMPKATRKYTLQRFEKISNDDVVYKLEQQTSQRSSGLLGKFVTAKLKNEHGAIQGWVISEKPLIIKGQSKTLYECKGKPVLVTNPPKRFA